MCLGSIMPSRLIEQIRTNKETTESSPLGAGKRQELVNCGCNTMTKGIGINS